MTATERRTELEKRRAAGLSLEIPFKRFDVRDYAKVIGALWDHENKAWLPKNEADLRFLSDIIAGREEIPSPVAAQRANELADALRERDAAIERETQASHRERLAQQAAQGLQGEVNALRAEVKAAAARGGSLLETRDALDAARAKLAAAGFPSLDAALAEVAALRARSAEGLRSLSGVNPAKIADFVADEARKAVLSSLRAQPPASPDAEEKRLKRANGGEPAPFRRIELDDAPAPPLPPRVEAPASKTQEVPDAPLTVKTSDPAPGGQAPASPPARAPGLARCEKCKAPILGKHVCRAATQKGGAS